MRLKHVKLMLAGAAMAVVLPGAAALSQDRQQDDRQPNQLNGAQRDQVSPEQNKQLVEKWYKYQASANQCEVELAQLALERLGAGGQQPGMGADQPRQPGAGGGTGTDRPGGQQQPGQPQGQRPGEPSSGAQPAGGMQPGQQPGSNMSQHREKLVQIAQMIQRDHKQALQDLRQRAEQDGVQLSETPELEPVHRAQLDAMRQKQGDEFIRAFAFGNMASHTHGILELSWAQENGPTDGIKQFARTTLPRVQQHAQQIAPVAYDIAGLREARTAGFGEDQPEQPGDRPGQGDDMNRPGGASGGADRPGGTGGGRPDNM